MSYQVTDFRPYLEAGFNIYNGECPSEHKQLGEIQVEITPGVVKERKTQNGKYNDAIYSKGFVGQFEHMSDKDLLDPIVSIANEMGGNGIALLNVRFDGVKWHVKGTAVLITPPSVATKIHD